MSNTKKMICNRCKKEKEELLGNTSEPEKNICYDCQEEIFDKGFESSQDSSDEMLLADKNELFDNDTIDRKEIFFIVSWYGMGTWMCSNCKKIRIFQKDTFTKNDEEKEAIVNKLVKPCPHCNASGHLKYIAYRKDQPSNSST